MDKPKSLIDIALLMDTVHMTNWDDRMKGVSDRLRELHHADTNLHRKIASLETRLRNGIGKAWDSANDQYVEETLAQILADDMTARGVLPRTAAEREAPWERVSPATEEALQKVSEAAERAQEDAAAGPEDAAAMAALDAGWEKTFGQFTAEIKTAADVSAITPTWEHKDFAVQTAWDNGTRIFEVKMIPESMSPADIDRFDALKAASKARRKFRSSAAENKIREPEPEMTLVLAPTQGEYIVRLNRVQIGIIRLTNGMWGSEALGDRMFFDRYDAARILVDHYKRGN